MSPGRVMLGATFVVLGLVTACGSASPPSRVQPSGFEAVSVVIRRADGSACTLCAYLARSDAQHQQGLMGVTDLGGRDGMLFQFPTSDIERFWMMNTVMPLTALWFDESGAFLDKADMAPCVASAQPCVLYGPELPTTDVLELPQGDDHRLRIGLGSRLESVGGPCPLTAT